MDGELIHSLVGHEGGIWAIDTFQDILVSGSTDRTVRIWDLSNGRCLHVFAGHTGTVRVLSIVKPELVQIKQDDTVTQERWPKRPLIVTGSRDHSLRVWTLPRPGETEFKSRQVNENSSIDDTGENPYHKLHLEGHELAVRALAGRGRIAVSGSYDFTVGVWDIITGVCKWVLTGHTSKVYDVVLDVDRDQVYSGSMDGTIRIWDIQTGGCRHILTGHTSLVCLLRLSPSYLVSGSADAILCVWHPTSGELHYKLAGHNGAITSFYHDERKVVSGADGTIKLWDIQDGKLFKDIQTGGAGVWQIACSGRSCVAAVNRGNHTFIDVWDFGDDDGHEAEIYSEGPFVDEEEPFVKGL
ncbi:hypothetical protein GALMADRAFT_138534 [Galerina marginata CBS 339.88]|uniref:Uncharacterized protein n=1 Tax=Galerina marginata (strain CBS 339.88) TaxID=685588 RepID=A0A067T518_GALM3|nr:hypothetical protein GALMADRAFT_138534 [Galerina marginata CBS 339.88]